MKKCVRDFLFNHLIDGAKKCLNRFNSETGRFLDEFYSSPEGMKLSGDGQGWAITNQDVVYAYAYLYKTAGENNPFFNNKDTFALILKSVQAWRDYQYPDMQMEFVKVNGECWGPIYMPWSWYHWLETYILLYADLDEATRTDWERAMMPGFEEFARQDTDFVHNIPVWQAMCLNRAGKFFNRRDWIDAANKLIKNACLAQTPYGYWEEHKGPTAGYHTIYMHALGLYYFHGGEVDVIDAIRRGTAFLQASTYPCGSFVDTHEGRRRYESVHCDTHSPLDNATGAVACVATVAGERYLETHMSHLSNEAPALPHLTAILFADDTKTPVDSFTGFESFADDELNTVFDKLSILRHNDCQVTLSAYTAPPTENRFGFDRQAFASIWSKNGDLIMGDGNSKNQPEMSTFLISDSAGSPLCYIPTDGRILSDGSLELNYSDFARCRIHRSISDKRIELSYCAELSDPSYSWRIALPLRPGFVSGNTPYTVSSCNGSTVIEFSGWRISFKNAFSLISPFRPYNSYVRDCRADLESCLLAVHITPAGSEITVIFERM